MHYIKQIALCTSIFFIACKGWSQIIHTEKTFGTQYNESCFSFIKTSDNGYAFLGSTTAPGAGALDIYLTKLDSNENVQWTKIYGGAADESGNCVRQTLDGGYIICGDEQSFGAGMADGYLIRTDASGNMLWSKTYGGTHHDIFLKVELTSDSNYITIGTTFSPGNHTGDILAVKFNDMGDTLWTRIIGDSVYDAATNIIPESDGGCTITGRVYSFGAGLRDVMLSRIDGNGNVVWFKTYGGLYTEEGMAVAHTSDNGYIITGGTETFAPGGLFDVYILKTDSVGGLEWSKVYGGDKIEATYCIVESPGGGYVVAGFTNSWAHLHLRTNDPLMALGDDSTHVLLMKVDALGDTVWTRAYGGTTMDEAYAVINGPDGGYVIGAYSNSFSANDSLDAFIINTDSLGVSGCHTYFISPHIIIPSTISNSYIPPVAAGMIITVPVTAEDTLMFVENDPCFGVWVEELNTVKNSGSISPNPFNVSAIIKLNVSLSSNTVLSVYDVFGKKLRTDKVGGAGTEINFDRKNLSDGVYFIEVNTNDQVIFTGKIILTRKR